MAFTTQFEDDFAGTLGPLDGRVRDGGTWESYGSPLYLDGEGHAYVNASTPYSYVYMPGMDNATGVALELVALFDENSTGYLDMAIEADSGGLTANTRIALESAGTVIRVNGFGFNFTVPRAGRTSARFRLEIDPIGPDLRYRIYVDEVLEHEEVNAENSTYWGEGVYLGATIGSFASTGTAMRLDDLKVESFSSEAGPPFWTGFVNTYEIP